MAIKPGEIAQEWMAVAMRMQRAARTQYVHKCKRVQMTVFTDNSGTPVVWLEPECVALEPSAAMDRLRVLTND